MSIKLLLADESITVRKVFQKVFGQNDYELAWVDRDDQILESVKNMKPDFVLLSENFPGVNLQVDIKEINSVLATPLSVIVMANYGESIDTETSILWGAAGLIHKPLDNRILKNLVDTLHLQMTQPIEKYAAINSSPDLSAKRSSKLQIPETQVDKLDQRAKILFDIFESFFNENMVVLSDAMTKAIAPRIALDISSRIIEQLQITDLPKQIMKMTKEIVNDLVPQITERVVTREIESFKTEAFRLLESEDYSDDNV